MAEVYERPDLQIARQDLGLVCPVVIEFIFRSVRRRTPKAVRRIAWPEKALRREAERVLDGFLYDAYPVGQIQ